MSVPELTVADFFALGNEAAAKTAALRSMPEPEPAEATEDEHD